MKVFLSYALAVGGLGFMIYVLTAAVQINLTYPGARLAMLNALRTSVNHADHLSRTVPGTFFDGIGAAIKLGYMAGSTDLGILAQTTRPGYDGAVTMIGMKWKSLFGSAKKAVLLAVGGAVLAISVHAFPLVHIVFAVFVLGAAIWVFIAKMDTERSILRARAELLPELDRAFAEGRFQRAG